MEETMNAIQLIAIRQEIALAKALVDQRKLADAQTHLERAHVLGQEHVSLHALSHWHMFRVALLRRDAGAALGQLVRLVLGTVGAITGGVPVGNTGGSDVNMFKPMPIDPELQKIIQGSRD
jgi:hypothetical protein